MNEKQTVPHKEHEQATRESRALVVTSELLQKKWLVIGIPLLAIAVAAVFISFTSSKSKTQLKAALDYESAKDAAELMKVHEMYPSTPYGAYALERAAKDTLDRGDYGKARELCDKFLNEYPNSNHAIFVKRYVAACLEDTGDYDKAIAEYKDILENDPRMAPIADSLNMAIGRCYEQLGEYETAKSYYEKVAPQISATRRAAEQRISVLASEALDRLERVKRKEKALESQKKELNDPLISGI